MQYCMGSIFFCSILKTRATGQLECGLPHRALSFSVLPTIIHIAAVAVQNSKTTFASFRSSVSFQGLNSTDDRDFLWNAFRQGACGGGYDVQTYQVLADAVAAAGLEVAYNSECSACWLSWSPAGSLDHLLHTPCRLLGGVGSNTECSHVIALAPLH